MSILKNLFIFVFSLFVFNIYSQDIPLFESDGWKRIYLATYPRSGNHWVRYLIEESTHIATSSVYKDLSDPIHLDNIFPWGAYSTENGYRGNCRQPSKNDPVIVKTHFPLMPSQTGDRYYSFMTIRIIRNPVDSCWSFFINHFPNHDYPNKVPHEFVVHFIKTWKMFHEYWNHEIDCISFKYESFLESPEELLKIILSFVGYKVSDEDIERAVSIYPPKNKELQHIEHFEREDLELMKSELKLYLKDFNYSIP